MTNSNPLYTELDKLQTQVKSLEEKLAEKDEELIGLRKAAFNEISIHNAKISKLEALNKELYEALKQWNKYLETPYPKNLIIKKHAYNLTEQALAHYEGKEK